VGERGPAPKRSEQKHRHTKAEDHPDRPPAARSFDIPEPDEGWHDVAKLWYRALGDSGQSIYYEPSDWAMAYVMAESMSRDMNPQVVGISERTGEAVIETVPLKGASLSAYLKGMTSLLVSEADRRRASIELQRTPQSDPGDEEAATIARLDDFRDRAAG
jgi:hypothetical protein